MINTIQSTVYFLLNNSIPCPNGFHVFWDKRNLVFTSWSGAHFTHSDSGKQLFHHKTLHGPFPQPFCTIILHQILKSMCRVHTPQSILVRANKKKHHRCFFILRKRMCELPEFWMLLVEVSALPGGPVSHLEHLHDDLIPLPPTLP